MGKKTMTRLKKIRWMRKEKEKVERKENEKEKEK